jgi:hypothetical protein
MLVSAISFSQLGMSTNETYGKELEYDFTDYVTIDLAYGSDSTLYWKERKPGGDANEKRSTIHLNEHTTLTAWLEKNKTVVSLYSEFATGDTYGFQSFSDERIRNLIGTIQVKSREEKDYIKR